MRPRRGQDGSVADPLNSDDEHVRFGAYCRLVGEAGDVPAGLLDQLANDADQVMADSVRVRIIERATSRDAVDSLIVRPDFGSSPVRRKADERRAVLDARDAGSEAQLLAVVGTGFKQAQLELLRRPDIRQRVLRALADEDATAAVRNQARQRAGR